MSEEGGGLVPEQDADPKDALLPKQTTETEAGCQRFFKSLVFVFVAVPIILVGSTFLLGWNETRAVCEAKAIKEGAGKTTEVGCNDSGVHDGELIMFQCDIQKEGLAPLGFPGTALQNLNVRGTGVAVKVEMLQCIETYHKNKTKDTLGGGTKTDTVAMYHAEWKSGPAPRFNYRASDSPSWIQNCGADNPPWPEELPANRAVYQPEVKVGGFVLSGDWVKKIPLHTRVEGLSLPSYFTPGPEGTYQANAWAQYGSEGIGAVRMTVTTNDWHDPTVTVLGQNEGGHIEDWTASSSWMCAGYTLGHLRPGEIHKDELFAAVVSESQIVTTILRGVGFLLVWFALSRLLEPLQVLADFIPVVGPHLGNSIETISCCVSCLPATACSMLVVGVMWLFLRPALGLSLIALGVLIMFGLGGFRFSRRSKAGDVEISPA